jgi:hypothetical protein
MEKEDNDEKQQQMTRKWLNLFLQAVIKNSISLHDPHINNKANSNNMSDAILTAYQIYGNVEISNNILSCLFSHVNNPSH